MRNRAGLQSRRTDASPALGPTEGGMAAKNYYMVLGVSRQESARGIQEAFRSLAKRYHPDRTGPQGTAAFQDIVEAYQVLSDPARRARPRGRCGVAPGCYRLFVEPHGKPAAIDRGVVILGPIPNAITEDERGFAHDPIVTIGVTSANYATTPISMIDSNTSPLPYLC